MVLLGIVAISQLCKNSSRPRDGGPGLNKREEQLGCNPETLWGESVRPKHWGYTFVQQQQTATRERGDVFVWLGRKVNYRCPSWQVALVNKAINLQTV